MSRARANQKSPVGHMWLAGCRLREPGVGGAGKENRNLERLISLGFCARSAWIQDSGKMRYLSTKTAGRIPRPGSSERGLS
ncbi:hypothetical protein TNCV_2876551 [Trichonephila clavipes]|nr:hypothetical protein TNCV_2876551 [Trichonephila clavipes]